MTSTHSTMDPSNGIVRKRKKRDLETAMNNLKQLLEPSLSKKGTRIKSKPSFLPKKVAPPKKLNRFTMYEDGEFRPDKLKRQRRMEKVVLRPKNELKVVFATNKRKLRTPHKGHKPSPNGTNQLEPSQDLITWFQLSSPPHRSLTDLTFDDLIRMDEDSLSDDDLVEILTCPSPVWWEEPPDEFKEGVLAVIEETKNVKNEDVSTDITYRVNITNKNIGNLDMNLLKRSKTVGELKNKAKIAKLEDILGNIKRRVANDDKVKHFSSDRHDVETSEAREHDDVNKQNISNIDANIIIPKDKKNHVTPDEIDGKDDNLIEIPGSREGSNRSGSKNDSSKPRTISSDGSETSWSGEDFLKNLENINIPIQNDNDTDKDHFRNNEHIVDNIDTQCKEIGKEIGNADSEINSNNNNIDLTKDTDVDNFNDNITTSIDTLKESNKEMLGIQSGSNILDVRLKKTQRSVTNQARIKSKLDNCKNQNAGLTAKEKMIDIENELEFALIETKKSKKNEENLPPDSINETILINDDSNDCLDTSQLTDAFKDNEDVFHSNYEDGIKKPNLITIRTETTEPKDSNQNSDTTETETSIAKIKNKTYAKDDNSIVLSESDRILNIDDKTLPGATIMLINNDVSLTKNIESVPLKSENRILKNNDLPKTFIEYDIKKYKGAIITKISTNPTSESPISIRSVTPESTTDYSEGMISDTNIQFIDDYEDKSNEDVCLKKANKNKEEICVDKNKADLFNKKHTQGDMDQDNNSHNLVESCARSLNNSLDDDDTSMEEEYLDIESDKNEDNQYLTEELDEENCNSTKLELFEACENINRHQDKQQYLCEKINVRRDANEKYINMSTESDQDLDSMEGAVNNETFGRKELESIDTIIVEDQENKIIKSKILFSRRKYLEETLGNDNKMIRLSADDKSSFEDINKVLLQENKILELDSDRTTVDDVDGVGKLKVEEIQRLEYTSDQENKMLDVDTDETNSEDLNEESKVVELGGREEEERYQCLEEPLDQENRMLGLDEDTDSDERRRSLEEPLDQENRMLGLDEDADSDERRRSLEEPLDQENRMLGLDEDTDSDERRRSLEEALDQENRILGLDEDADSDERRSVEEALDQENRMLDLDADTSFEEDLNEASSLNSETDEVQCLNEALNNWHKILEDDSNRSNLEDEDVEIAKAENNRSLDAVDQMDNSQGLHADYKSLEGYLCDEKNPKSEQIVAFVPGDKPGLDIQDKTTLKGFDDKNKAIELSAGENRLDKEKTEETLEGEDINLEDKIIVSKDTIENKIDTVKEKDRKRDELMTVYQIVDSTEDADGSFEDDN